jgi:hypothetical protein
MAKGREETPILVNYPQLNESIKSSHYAFRIEAKVAGHVEISIDDGAWQPCRHGAGYWWYDWNVGKSGKHKAVARIRQQGGTESLTFPRYFMVGGGNGNGEKPAPKQAPMPTAAKKTPGRKPRK